MTRDEPLDPQRLQSEFHRLRRLDPAARATELEALVRDDPSLARTLGELLALDAVDGAALDGSALEQFEAERDVGRAAWGHAADARSGVSDARTALPERIGPYRVVQVLGRGGMGVVVLGERDSPRRRVAIKCLLADPSNLRAHRAFVEEQETLARMSHPGIVAIYESGVLDDATASEGSRAPVPWFAMELVEGRTLDAWLRASEGVAAANATSASEAFATRVRILEELVEIVAHAHARGVVHADLKPANILVDAAGRVHVLDFGIAHSALSAEDFARDACTPGYASPEVLRAEEQSLERSRDVYALGLLGHEILVGQQLQPRGAEGLVAIARRGAIAPPPLRAALPRASRELAAILARATAEDPAERYEDAILMAEDLSRARERLPIRAIPPSLAYSLRCVARRNPVLVGSIALLVASLATALVLATRARTEARSAERAAVARSEEAQREAARASRMLDFMTSVVASSRSNAAGRDATVREAVDEFAARASSELARDPAAAALLQVATARASLAAGDLDMAEARFAKARELAAPLAASDSDPRSAGARALLDCRLGDAEVARGRGDIRRARALFVPLARSDAAPADLAPLEVRVRATVALAELDLEAGAAAEALDMIVRMQSEVEAERQRAAERGDPHAAFASMGDMAEVGREADGGWVPWRVLEAVRVDALVALGRVDEAERAFERIVASTAAIEQPGPLEAEVLETLARFAIQRSDLVRAARLQSQAADIFNTCYGPRHRRSALASAEQSRLLAAVGEADAARAAAERAMPGLETLDAGRAVDCVVRLGRLEQALGLPRRAADTMCSALDRVPSVRSSPRARATLHREIGLLFHATGELRSAVLNLRAAELLDREVHGVASAEHREACALLAEVESLAALDEDAAAHARAALDARVGPEEDDFPEWRREWLESLAAREVRGHSAPVPDAQR